MIHLTLNTGHSRVSLREEVDPGVVRILGALLTPGEHPMPAPPGYRLRVSIEGAALLATVVGARDGRPLATIGVAPDDAAAGRAWPELERLYYRITDLPGFRAADFEAARRPASAPWVAVVLALATPDEAAWLGDFERCLAWAWAERFG